MYVAANPTDYSVGLQVSDQAHTSISLWKSLSDSQEAIRWILSPLVRLENERSGISIRRQGVILAPNQSGYLEDAKA